MGPGIDKRISDIRYEHYCLSLQERVKSIYELRRDSSIGYFITLI